MIPSNAMERKGKFKDTLRYLYAHEYASSGDIVENLRRCRSDNYAHWILLELQGLFFGLERRKYIRKLSKEERKDLPVYTQNSIYKITPLGEKYVETYLLPDSKQDFPTALPRLA